jgi:nucleoside 2-deoxyribosyltransferase
MNSLSNTQLRLYFAGPLFNQAERQFNERLCLKLEELGIGVFLPQRDGAESSRPPYNEMSKDERRRAMFAMDRDKILAADIFLFVLDGRVPDEGACVELGIAYGQRYLTQQKKLLVGLRTDKRTAFAEAMLNPMISQALDKVCLKEEELLDYLTRVLKENKQCAFT